MTWHGTWPRLRAEVSECGEGWHRLHRRPDPEQILGEVLAGRLLACSTLARSRGWESFADRTLEQAIEAANPYLVRAMRLASASGSTLPA